MHRPPIPHVQDLPDGDPAFGQITAAELHSSAEDAIATLAGMMADGDWPANHPNWPYTSEQQYWQLLRDFELVRQPMLFGKPTEPITRTRNPARGFLDLRREVVLALVTVGGMSWGASDFGPGSSGDIMHFDLGTH